MVVLLLGGVVEGTFEMSFILEIQRFTNLFHPHRVFEMIVIFDKLSVLKTLQLEKKNVEIH